MCYQYHLYTINTIYMYIICLYITKSFCLGHENISIIVCSGEKTHHILSDGALSSVGQSL